VLFLNSAHGLGGRRMLNSARLLAHAFKSALKVLHDLCERGDLENRLFLSKQLFSLNQSRAGKS
jgi:hypothetical protein